MTLELDGKSLYITGTIKKYTKKELRKIVERKGMIWMKAINGALDYLVVGEEPGARKLEKASEIGIKVIPWEEFRIYIGL